MNESKEALIYIASCTPYGAYRVRILVCLSLLAAAWRMATEWGPPTDAAGLLWRVCTKSAGCGELVIGAAIALIAPFAAHDIYLDAMSYQS